MLKRTRIVFLTDAGEQTVTVVSRDRFRANAAMKAAGIDIGKMAVEEFREFLHRLAFEAGLREGVITTDDFDAWAATVFDCDVAEDEEPGESTATPAS